MQKESPNWGEQQQTFHEDFANLLHENGFSDAVSVLGLDVSDFAHFGPMAAMFPSSDNTSKLQSPEHGNTQAGKIAAEPTLTQDCFNHVWVGGVDTPIQSREGSLEPSDDTVCSGSSTIVARNNRNQKTSACNHVSIQETPPRGNLSPIIQSADKSSRCRSLSCSSAEEEAVKVLSAIARKSGASRIASHENAHKVIFGGADPAPSPTRVQQMSEDASKAPPLQSPAPTPERPNARVVGARSVSEECTPTPSRRDKGLRAFSHKVCQKVEEKGTTTYHEVAEELVSELERDEIFQFEDKNIRRRVYDAINVLIAIDVIHKDSKKQITWKGIPLEAGKKRELVQGKIRQAEESLAQKRLCADNKRTQLFAMRSLLARNATANPLPEAEASGRRRRQWEELGTGRPADRLQLPFVVMRTSPQSEVVVEVARDRREVMLHVEGDFDLLDDLAVVRSLPLAQAIPALQIPTLMASAAPIAAAALAVD